MHTLPPLPYEYEALVPVIDEETMKLHYDKHHKAYIDKLNKALETAPELAELSVEDLLGRLDSVPENIKQAVRNHGGGHANHSLWWTILRPPVGDNVPNGEVLTALKEAFESFENFKTKFAEAAAGQFGSGWAWLTYEGGTLAIKALPNQDSPLMSGATPLLGLDVWEHAYYLNYQNRRPEYIENFFSIINWDEVARRLTAAKA